jgi:PAS domain S-box-containing protein
MDLFKLLTKNSFDIISVLADDGAVKFESDAVEKILGYKPGERIGKSVFDYVHPNDKEYVIKEFSTRDKKIKRLEFRFAHKNGSWVWIEAIGQDFLNDPEVNGIIVNSRDISEQKKEQQKLAKSEKGYKRLIDNSNAFIMEVDADNYEVVSCNQVMAKSLNHSVQNLIGKNIKELLPPEVLSKRIEYGNKALEQNKVQQFEDERDGRCFMNHFIPYTDQEKRYIQTITYEITEHWKTERALSDSETKYKELFQFLEEGFLRADKNGIITMANNSIAALAGYESPEELIGLSMNKLYAIPSERSKMLADLKKKGTLRNYEIRLITKSGDLRWSSCNIKFFKDQHNEIAGTEGLVRDITGQKRLEEKLQESQQRFKQFMDHIPGAAFLKDRDNKLLYCNQEYASMLGTTPENLIYEDMTESIPEELQKIYFQENLDIIQKRKPIVSESAFPSEKGITHWLTYKFPVSVNEETFIGAISIDITRRKQAEEALKESEEKFKTIFNMALSMICIADINTATFKVINPSFSRVLGYTEQELLSKPFLDFVHPDDKESTMQVVEKALKAGNYVIHFENRYRCKDNTYRWISWNSYPIVEKGITYAIGTDVTERKEHEIALKEANTKLTIQNTAFESSIDGIAILNKNQKYTYLNQAHAEIYGYASPDELMNKSWKVLYDKDELKRFEDNIMPDLIKNGFWSGEAIGLKKQGTKFYQQISLTMLENGGVICMVRDTSKQKQIEIDLQNSEAKFRSVSSISSDYAYSFKVNKDGTLEPEWDFGAFEKISGYSAKELHEKGGFGVLIHPDDLPEAVKRVEKQLKGETVISEFRIICRNGKIRWVRDKGVPEWSKLENRVIRIIGSASDITEKKKAEQALQESEYLHRQVLSNISDAVFLTDINGGFTFICPNVKYVFGYQVDEVQKMQNIENLIPALQNLDMDVLKRQKEVQNYECTIFDKSKEKHSLIITAKLIDFNKTEILYSCRDITDRKKA